MRLIELLQEELSLFKQIKQQTKMQTELLVTDDIERLNESLNLREQLKEKINGLHHESKILMQSYILSNISHERGKVKEIDTIKEQIRDIIMRCKEINDNNFETAKSKMDEYTKRIKELDTSKKTFDAYSFEVISNPEHFDKKH